MTRIWIITLFPEYFVPLCEKGVVGRYLGQNDKPKFKVSTINLRDFSDNKYGSVDDYPFGGGDGMVLRADILKAALVEGVMAQGGYSSLSDLTVISTGPKGELWDQKSAKKISTGINEKTLKDLVFICGRYEGIDQRFLDKYVNEEYSLGDFVLSGGELAVASMLDSTLRMVDGVLGKRQSFETDSFYQGLLGNKVYTRPRVFEGEEVPEILLSGHHKKIADFQLESSKAETKNLRPDLWKDYNEE